MRKQSLNIFDKDSTMMFDDRFFTFEKNVFKIIFPEI